MQVEPSIRSLAKNFAEPVRQEPANQQSLGMNDHLTALTTGLQGSEDAFQAFEERFGEVEERTTGGRQFDLVLADSFEERKPQLYFEFLDLLMNGGLSDGIRKTSGGAGIATRPGNPVESFQAVYLDHCFSLCDAGEFHPESFAMQDIFSPFSWVHLLVIVLSLLSWGGLLWWARRSGSRDAAYVLRLGLAAFILATNLFWTYYKFRPERWNPDSSWPLHLCDFAWMAGVISLLTAKGEGALIHELTFFWGIGLSTQAYFTPTLRDGPALIDFWMFWLAHWQIVALPLLNVLAFGMRPSLAGARRSIVVTILLAAPITVVNLLADTPYFFTGKGSPDNPTMIDHLGPWPWRLITLTAIVSMWFLILAFIFRRRQSERS